jgi:hypothetical protein
MVHFLLQLFWRYADIQITVYGRLFMAISLDSIYSSGSGQRYNPQIANLTLKGQVSRALISGFPAQ